MKKICLITLLTLLGGWLFAQTNVVNEPKPPRAPTVIDSDRADFDVSARRATYHGNVRVDDPQLKMTCDLMVVELPLSGGHINHLVAMTNVVMYSVDDKGQTNHATSDKAIYDYNVENGVTNETVTLTGNARVQSGQDWMTGEPIIWDRIKNSFHAENQRMILHPNVANVISNTNSAAGKINLPPRTMQSTNSPHARTNYPPGTIQNIDKMILQSGTTTQ